MTIKPIRTDEDLRTVFHRLESIFQADEGTPEADERDVLVTLIEAYENQHYAFGPADPVEAIKFRMEQQGLTARDLEAERARLGGTQPQAATEPSNGQATSRGLAHPLREPARWDVTLKTWCVESGVSPL
jgi:antitoxin component HigA of HigAB toxin-antitoxin module